VDGVDSCVVGYAGGNKEWPTYRNIQDHTEAIRIIFDPSVVTYEEILRHFFRQHSSSSQSWSRQYRSAILTHNEEQTAVAQALIAHMSKKTKVYTSVEAAQDFYRAEEYHQKYMEKSQRGRF
jgi:peptide-methionine (S)-S-oxide reductase